MILPEVFSPLGNHQNRIDQAMSSITQTEAPEKEELLRKKEELKTLEQELGESELELSTLKRELYLFEKRYNQEVGEKYAELDKIKAQVLDLASKLEPQSKKFKEDAESAQEHARQSSQEGGAQIEIPFEESQFKPTDELKKMFRDAAKKIHPDLTADPEERTRRHHLMTKLNQAYDQMDEDQIRSVLIEWEDGLPMEEEASVGVKLTRVLRQIAQVRKRFKSINSELYSLENSEMFRLKETIEGEAKTGRDVMAEMISDVEEKIRSIKTRMANLATDVTRF